MVAVTSANADRFLADPPSTLRTLLLYGPDAGLVAERATGFVRTVLGDAADPLSVIRLDSDALATDPGRLADEANAQSLFTGHRVIHVHAFGSRSIIAAVEPVLAVPPIDTRIVIEAGDLRKSAPLRSRCEAAKSAAAVPCFAEDARLLDRLIDEELRTAGFSIAPDARAALRQSIGVDRMASRGEIRKLCLYAAGTPQIELADVRAIVGDAADTALDELLDSVSVGDIARSDRNYRRLLAAGTSPAAIGTAVQRHFQTLQRLRAAVANGVAFDAAVDGIFPRFFGAHRTAAERALRIWSPAALGKALERIDAAVTAGRLNGPIVAAVIGEMAAALAAQAAARDRSAARLATQDT